MSVRNPFDESVEPEPSKIVGHPSLGHGFVRTPEQAAKVAPKDRS